jgi:dephospho-CoA kinase
MQVQRLMKRDGIGYEKAHQRLQAQIPIDDKISHADFIINNDQTVEQTRRQVDALWQTLQTLKQHRRTRPL